MTATDTRTAPTRTDREPDDVGHSVCLRCWPHAATEPSIAACGQWLPAAEILGHVPPGIAVCPLCVLALQQGATCGHR